MIFKKRKINYKFILLALFGFLIICELVLRFRYGFCDAVLYNQDPDLEYIFQPNQSRKRFGNHIRINEFSMRGDPIKKSSLKILGLGDSVIEGGALMEQDSLATSRLSRALSACLDTTVQVLSVAVGSWGPDNCAAYLKRHGEFGASMILLVVSSHDAHDNITYEQVVGNDPHYPKKEYSLALIELFDRYVKEIFFTDHSDLGIHKDGKVFNTGFQYILETSKRLNIPLIIYLHSEISERKSGDYNNEGKEIIAFAKKNNIQLIRELDYTFDEHDYLDYIHLSQSGQKRLYEIVYPVLSKELSGVTAK